MEAVRRAMADLGADAKPMDIKNYLWSKFTIDMDNGMISSYKSSLTRKAAGQSAVLSKPAAAPRGGWDAGFGSGISLEDIRAVKDLAGRLGPERVRELTELFSG
jgi:hypothetical protein